MFSSLKSKLLLMVYVLVLLSIPVGSYLASQNQNPLTQAQAKPSASPRASLKPLTPLPQASTTTTTPTDLPEEEATDSAGTTTFGPTLNLKINIEGRPSDNQATKLFVGIAEVGAGALKYLLSFTVDMPKSGAFEGISLAGLNPGTNYNAILKGPAQLATSSAFTMGPSITNLNGGNPINLTTGDLNEDNVINSADYSIVKTAFGTKSGSANWNDNIDLNKDGVINALDIAIITKNLSKTGDSGVWVSPVPTGAASGSATIQQPASASGTPYTPNPPGQTGGYWFWMPKI